MAAYSCSIPIVLHEQTQKAGLASRLIARIAAVVCISFPSSEQYFNNKNIVLTGNPIRESFFESRIIDEFECKKPFIYITGGSTGSLSINLIVGAIISELLKEFVVFHQTGNNTESVDYDNLIQIRDQLPRELREKYILRNFFTPEEVSYLFKNSQLVVSRAGINTILELMVTKAVGLLIPFPYGQKNEQKENSKLYVSEGFGESLDQNTLTPQLLLKKIHDMIENKDKYANKPNIESKYVNRNSVDKIIEQIYLYGKRTKSRYTSKEKKNFIV